ncbi:IclR family transcriptional regulator [Herbaspirillum sp. meg3]|jgi:DNA-binding IclR family transcriptional regulator|uniref:IclR family transcriptional regulator n=1 Tax=Herbaspirillum sp. meg3 TaxID=2025949 RepID=UPI000B97FC0A|nr:IclR family transcriptional regulator [Herbaspirillum sp. meg3]ASU40547.1 IclR family transcriptional regulator [Herbaspirillum sp. meg3]
MPRTKKIVPDADLNVDSTEDISANDSATDAGKARYAAPALDKGLDILELLSKSEQMLTLNQISKQLGRSVNEIFRMVVTLEQRGYLIADNDQYRLSLKLFELAHYHQPIRSLVSTALPHMRELANRTMQSTHLTVYEAGRVIVVAQVDSPERWAFGLKVGALVSLTDTASGHVLLSFRDEAERGRMLAAHVRMDGEQEIDHAQLLRQIAETQERGYSRMESRQIRGVVNLSYPVLGANDRMLAALNIPYIERIDKKVNPSLDEVQGIVQEISSRLSKLMGSSSFGS